MGYREGGRGEKKGEEGGFHCLLHSRERERVRESEGGKYDRQWNGRCSFFFGVFVFLCFCDLGSPPLVASRVLHVLICIFAGV